MLRHETRRSKGKATNFLSPWFCCYKTPSTKETVPILLHPWR
jgi:hypothetical protein